MVIGNIIVNAPTEKPSFFVNGANFTGTGEPSDKRKRAFRADIDESADLFFYLPGVPLSDRKLTLRRAHKGQDRGQGDQPVLR